MKRYVCRLAALAVVAAAVGCGGSDKGVDKPDNPAPKPASKAVVS